MLDNAPSSFDLSNVYLTKLEKDLLEKKDEMIKYTIKKYIYNLYNSYDSLYYYKGINEIINYLRTVNKYINTVEPWKILKSNNNNNKIDRIGSVLYCICESIKVTSTLLYPVIPKSSKRALKFIIPNIDNINIDLDLLKPNTTYNKMNLKRIKLFHKYDE